MIERYHESLRCIYVIVVAKISEIDSNAILQMSFKAFNDSTNFDDLIFTLFMFEAYFKMIEMNAFSLTITQRSIVMRKTMNEVQKLIVTSQLNDALNIWNDSFLILIHNLSLNFDVFVYHEENDNQSKLWKDLFKILNVNDESTIIELLNESTKFRSTMIKSYYDDNYLQNSSFFISIDFSFIAFISKSSNMSQSNDQFAVSNDQNSESETFLNSLRRDCDRFRKYFASIAFLSFVFNAIVDFVFVSISLLVFAVAFKFDSVVHIALSQFVAFRQKEINKFIEKDVFQSVNKNDVSTNVRIFNFTPRNDSIRLDWS
jgi:hypothetical protein